MIYLYKSFFKFVKVNLNVAKKYQLNNNLYTVIYHTSKQLNVQMNVLASTNTEIHLNTLIQVDFDKCMHRNVYNSGRCYQLASSTLVKGPILEGSASLNFKHSSCGYNGNDMLNFEGNTIIISYLNRLCTFQKCLILNCLILSLFF